MVFYRVENLVGMASRLLGLMRMILPVLLMVGGLIVVSWWWWWFVFEYDAFDEIRDDRLWRDGVCGSILLDLGVFYFLGNVGLLG